MTADVGDGESGNKTRRAFAGGTAGAERYVGPLVEPEGRLKGGYKAADRGTRVVDGGFARDKRFARQDSASVLPGRLRLGVLKTREDPKDLAEQIRRELDNQFASSDAVRTPESDGDGRREDGAEDHYEEGDPATGPGKDQQQALGVDATLRVLDGGGWESFLLQRNLKVLLVEDDDSTRHVVGALLRNCNYEGRYFSRLQAAFGMCCLRMAGRLDSVLSRAGQDFSGSWRLFDL